MKLGIRLKSSYVGYLAGVSVAVASLSGPLNIARAETKIDLSKFFGISAVTFSPDSRHLAVAPQSPFQPFEVQEVSSGKQILAIQPKWRPLEAYAFRAVSFSPDGKWLALGGTDGLVRIWDVATKKEVRQYAAYGDDFPEQDAPAGYPDVVCLNFSPDSRWIASGCGRWVQVRELTSGKVLHELTDAYRVAFSPDGKTFACAHGDSLKLWSMDGKRELQSIKFPGQSEAISIAFSPDGTKLAIAWRWSSGSVVEVSSGEELFPLRALHPPSQGVGRVAYSPDGRFVAGSTGKHIVLWSVREKMPLRVLDGHPGSIFDLAFSPDGKHLASCGEYRTVFIWSIPTGEVVRKIQFPVPERPGPINREDYFYDREGKPRRRPGK